MRTAKSKKLQCLLISELLNTGSVQLILPDGITLDIGILQEDQSGETKKADDYCYVVASRRGRTALLDSYNLGLRYEPAGETIVCEDETTDSEGRQIRTLEVV